MPFVSPVSQTSSVDQVRVSEVQFALKGANVEQLLKNLSYKISRDIKCSALAAHGHLTEKADRRPGIGDGIAVFDWLCADVDEPYVLLSRLEHVIEDPLLDDEPVSFVLSLVYPEADSVTHLCYLARLTRFFRETGLLERLRDARSEDEMRSILLPENKQFMAA